MPGPTLDITIDDHTGQPYDFSIKAQRDKAEALIDAQQPVLLIGSPMCTAFSVIQAINKARRDPLVVERELVAGGLHLTYIVSRSHAARTSWTDLPREPLRGLSRACSKCAR